ncbi:hypothetical protein [Veronia pacifica]|uniref:Jacalin-type lectin domain-containing protein n=1 Tax=Veronia pacifica TaxID=1080227 RepID=A0A1C3EA98_9GAMM|nr:hypothetical protein [Veronia pacifica]ODA30140.1 hypothetical protein A8L45_21095 [Veronia pacifica]
MCNKLLIILYLFFISAAYAAEGNYISEFGNTTGTPTELVVSDNKSFKIRSDSFIYAFKSGDHQVGGTGGHLSTQYDINHISKIKAYVAHYGSQAYIRKIVIEFKFYGYTYYHTYGYYSGKADVYEAIIPKHSKLTGINVYTAPHPYQSQQKLLVGFGLKLTNTGPILGLTKGSLYHLSPLTNNTVWVNQGNSTVYRAGLLNTVSESVGGPASGSWESADLSTVSRIQAGVSTYYGWYGNYYQQKLNYILFGSEHVGFHHGDQAIQIIKGDFSHVKGISVLTEDRVYSWWYYYYVFPIYLNAIKFNF